MAVTQRIIDLSVFDEILRRRLSCHRLGRHQLNSSTMKALAPLAAALVLAASTALAAAPAKNPLAETEWLAKNLTDPKVRVIEVSVDAGIYEQGHIPGAANVRWHTDLVDQPRRDIVTQEQFEKLVSKLGITPDTTVVLYGDNNNWFAAWGAWVFKLYGHADVRLLDGGRKKWELEKRPYDNVAPTFTATKYQAKPANAALRARLPEVVLAAEKKANVALLDIRSPDEYAGKVIAPPGSLETAIRAGHVPTAVNVPWGKAVNPDTGAYKPVEELRKIYAEAGIDGKRPIIAYCRIGERSAHTWFALTQILGYDAKQYDGSWTEYGNSVGVPIVNLAGTVWTGK